MALSAKTVPWAKAGAPMRPVWRLMAVSALALTTANCAQNTQKLAGASGSAYDPKYGVKASRRLYQEGDVIPKGGGRRFSGKPYVVAGRTYVPREDARGYVREGLASWYGAAFHGRMTANGEVFDRHSIAAAHPTLPLPSYVRVTNLANQHSMIVRVNDRGPYHANRVMDVSEEVAQALDFHNRGTAKVRVEYVGRASTAGSDDRKLLATLRTDGEPASVRGRSPVMMADLGPDTAPAERLSRASNPALAFKPEGEEAAPQAVEEAAPAPRPPRPAPVLMAASVAVPPALQPTAAAAETFRPVRAAAIAAEAPPPRVALAANRPPRGAEPLSLAPPPMRLAGARPERTVTAGISGGVSGLNPARDGHAAPATRSAAVGKPNAETAFTAPPARLVAASNPAARMPARASLAAAPEARPKGAPVPVRMAAAPSAGGPAQMHAGAVRAGPPAGRLAAVHASPAPLPASAKAALGKLALATASAKPAKAAAVAAGTKPGPAARRAQVAQAN